MTRDRSKSLMIGTAALALGALALSSCGEPKKPSGQVVARVGNTEITRTQLDTEMKLLNVPPAQRAVAGPVILQQLVDRALFVKAAEDAKMTQNPNIVLLVDRARSAILEQAYLSQATAGARSKPSDSEIETFMENHPQAGPDRMILRGTQLTFKIPPADSGFMAAIRAAKSQDDLVGALNSRKIKFGQQPFNVDTAALPDEILNGIKTLSPGEPFVMISGSVAQAITIADKTPQPLSGDQQRLVAIRRIMSDRTAAAIANRRKTIRLGVNIDYAPGYAPPAQPDAKPKPN